MGGGPPAPWLLYDGGARAAEARLDQAKQDELQAHLELLRDTTSGEVTEAVRSLKTRRSALDAAKTSLDLSRETVHVVRAQYEAGQATQLELLQAQDALVSADVGVAQARLALELAGLELQRATGTFPLTANDPKEVRR